MIYRVHFTEHGIARHVDYDDAVGGDFVYPEPMTAEVQAVALQAYLNEKPTVSNTRIERIA